MLPFTGASYLAGGEDMFMVESLKGFLSLFKCEVVRKALFSRVKLGNEVMIGAGNSSVLTARLTDVVE